MRRSILVLLAAAATAAPLAAQQQQSSTSANAAVGAVRANWQSIHNFVLRSAEQAPESLFTFKPAPTVRSLGQLFAHIAGAENMFCSMALAEPMKPEDEFEKVAGNKAALVAALKASGTYCEKAYTMADADSHAMIDVFGRPNSKLYALTMNATHDGEHYGNIVTYLRIKGMVPPSSQR